MPRWEDAERQLAPALANADAQVVYAHRLENIQANSAQYAYPINDAVQYFIDTVWAYETTELRRIMTGHAPRSKESAGYVSTVAGPLYISNGGGRHVSWSMGISTKGWARVSGYENRFVVQSNGRWYFAYNEYRGDMTPDREVCVYGYDENQRFVLSSFPPVEYGTVSVEVQKCLAAILYYYGLPLPT